MFRSSIRFFCLYSFLFLMAGCSEAPDQQFTQVTEPLSFSAATCQSQMKMIEIRNDDLIHPQRIQGVQFELGTNTKGVFKLDKVVLGSNTIKATGGKVDELIIPTGGVLKIFTSYHPKELTTKGVNHSSVLDVYLNGPKLGVIQVRLNGIASTATPGCTAQGEGEIKKFKITNLKMTVKAAGIPNGQFVNDITPDNRQDTPVEMTIKDGKVTLDPEHFPSFDLVKEVIPLPGNKLTISLKEEAQGSFDGSKLSVEGAVFTGSGVLDVEGTLTTESVTASGQSNISLTGSALENGKIKLVFAGKIPDNVPSDALKGGVVGVEFEFEEITE